VSASKGAREKILTYWELGNPAWRYEDHSDNRNIISIA
jgi:hypothetical protein